MAAPPQRHACDRASRVPHCAAMPRLFHASPLVAALTDGLPPAALASLVAGTNLHASAIERFVALWLGAANDEAVAVATKDRSAGCVGIVAPGNLFIATWQLIVEVLALGGTARVRASGRDQAAAEVLVDLLRAIEPAWAARVEVRHFDPGDAEQWADFAHGLQAVVAQGGDAAMLALQGRLRGLNPDLAIRLHGHRLSWALASSSEAVLTSADGLAHDMLLGDGRGCMTPRALLVQGGIDDAARTAAALHPALVDAARALPPGLVPANLAATQRAWIEQQRFDAAMAGQSFHALMSPGFSLVVRGGAPGRHLDAADLGPGGRMLVVRPAPEKLAVLGSLCAITSTVGLAPGSAVALAATLRSLGVGRCCDVGQMQAPPWSQTSDGEPLGQCISVSSLA